MTCYGYSDKAAKKLLHVADKTERYSRRNTVQKILMVERNSRMANKIKNIGQTRSLFYAEENSSFYRWLFLAQVPQMLYQAQVEYFLLDPENKEERFTRQEKYKTLEEK